ncbi:MAG: PDZ domain-containing protein [Lacunisphaera sp.]|nr:PDZ domain-containing protein [Lacunisphaera sp.]
MNKSPLPRSAACLLLACLCPALCAAAPVPIPVEESITLPKVQVQGNIICNFGFGLVATWDKKTQRIGHVYIEEVVPGSEAEKLGLQRGDEILAINGQRVADMKGGMQRGSDLFEVLGNQPVGRTIDVEVAVRIVKQVILTATP